MRKLRDDNEAVDTAANKNSWRRHAMLSVSNLQIGLVWSTN